MCAQARKGQKGQTTMKKKLTTDEKIAANLAAMKRHGIETAEDFANYCRPPCWLVWTVSAFASVVAAAVALPFAIRGYIPGSAVFASGIVGGSFALAVGSLLRTI